MRKVGWLAVALTLLLAGAPVEASAFRLDARRFSGIPRSLSGVDLALPSRGVWVPRVSVTELPIPGGGGIGSCSVANPARCDVFAGGNSGFGRRDFVWSGDTRDGFSALLRSQGVNRQLFANLCDGAVGLSNSRVAKACNGGGGPGPGIPEPGAALVFGLGLAGVAARVRRRG